MVEWTTHESKEYSPKTKQKEKWRKWFAWYPVIFKTENHLEHWIWLKTIFKKGVLHYDGYDGHYWWSFEYKLKKEIKNG